MTYRVGTVIYLNRFGDQGGYGIIREGVGGAQHLFTLEDVDDYTGGDTAGAGYVPDAQVEFTLKEKPQPS